MPSRCVTRLRQDSVQLTMTIHDRFNVSFLTVKSARIPVMKAVALMAVVPALLAAALKPSPRELLDVARPLTITEIATVLSASRKAVAAKTFRMSSLPGGRGPEVLMGPAGQPKITRTL